MRIILLLTLVACVTSSIDAQDGAPHKYALLVAVREYEHPEINEPLLAYPEEDAKAVRDLLSRSGYEVNVLLGKQASQANIRKQLGLFSNHGGNKGVVLVGLFGHGVEFDSTRKSYFCPYDTSLKAVRDSNGRIISRDDGQPRMEPDINKLISIDDVLIALKESKATNRVLLTDCCRNDPNAARGRSFGTSLEINQLPKNTAVLFACSAQQKAHEHKDWGHGAFTKCLLDAIHENTARGTPLMGRIAEDIEPAVEKLVASKTREEQTPRYLSTGARIDLQLKTTKDQQFEGLKAADRRELVPRIFFCWCPPGTMTMGSPKSEPGREADEDQVSVRLSSGFWMGETEVTQGQWQALMGTLPWKGQESVKEGDDYAASYISHDDAMQFCQKLTLQERQAGRLPLGWKFALPTEAQWEYACRAGTQSVYSFGDQDTVLSDYGWFSRNAGGKGEKYPHRVGLKIPNAWGLHDMHGNVWEWCRDWSGQALPGGQDPTGPRAGERRVNRGGAWSFGPPACRSAFRGSDRPASRFDILGFRLAAVRE